MDFNLAEQEQQLGFRYGYGWFTLFSLFFIFVFHYSFSSRRRNSKETPVQESSRAVSESDSSSASQFGISDLVSDADLEFLIRNLGDRKNPDEKWENVIHKTNDHLSYSASCLKPKDAPIKYLSTTVFENCSPELLKDFYMDSDYRLQWDNTLLHHHQLQLHPSSGIEVGRTIKKFPFLTPREYVLAWRLWQTSHPHTFYCFIKDCEHPLAPRQKKYVRVGSYRSGWRIRKVPGRNACEITMYHQEDAGLNVEMAKLAFAKGIWSYICKMDNALRKYIATTRPQVGPALTAVSLIQKVPLELEPNVVVDIPTTSMDEPLTDKTKEKKLSRRPSKKVLANGLLLLGGLICLSRGHSSLGAKVALGYFLTKLRKRDASPGQSREG
ncbi:uncharacterized protein LOC126673265 [Mercurialis annua]|uniref:uncharacterized protein LOC126673265 n=1 Tax=Mercurialis annua TaxID=3986 RepID=UPI00215E02B3|nr:uncharacterized protein LOC126673265 [Mercurialis annua]XP_055960947.1 uncharacterized protein LOC126673265 [Mercurialis annua]